MVSIGSLLWVARPLSLLVTREVVSPGSGVRRRPSPLGWPTRVLPRASGLARRVAVRVPANHQPPTEDGRSGAATKPSHFEVSSAHDWFLLSQRSAGLTLYWFANNIITTAQTLILRKTTTLPEAPAAAAAGRGGANGAEPVRVEYVPKSQRRSALKCRRGRRPRLKR